MGLGWRRELAAPLLTSPHAVGFVEVIAESCFRPGPVLREVQGLAEIWPVLPHGIKLSLGSADGIDAEHAHMLGKLARTLRAPLLSEHVAFTRGRGRDIGHLTQLPMTRAAVAVVARNLAKARRLLPDIPFLLENPAWTLRWSEDEMAEGAFFHEVTQATGCELLLDIANLYANATNSGQDPRALLRSYPLNRVAMVHIAGGAWREGFYVDTHCHPTPAPVFDLLAELVRIRGPLPVVLERDGRYPAFSELASELAQAQQILRSEPGQSLASSAAPTVPSLSAAPANLQAAAATSHEHAARIHALAGQQARLAQLLTQAAQSSSAPDLPPRDATAAKWPLDPLPWDPRELDRSRSVLLYKRVDEALAVLGRLRAAAQAQRIDLYALALDRLASLPPAGSAPAVVDALAIARQLAQHAVLSTAAQIDQLSLQARFVEHGEGASPRFLPYLARTQRADGRKTWVWKPPGQLSRLRFYTPATSAPPDGSQSRTP